MRTLTAIRVGLFVTVLVIPLLGTRPKTVPLPYEQRSRASLPALRTARYEYPEQFDAFVRDNLGGRDRLIRWHNLLKFHVFRESPVRPVIVGRKEWLFYSWPDDGLDIRNFSGRWPHRPSDIERWLDSQDTRDREYTRLGSRYLIAVAPDKQSVYPEFVPARFGPPAPGVLAKLLQHLGAHPRLQVLDLTPVLRRRRDELQLYYKADSHWNGQGAFLAAQAIADRLRQSLPSVGTIRDDDYVRADVPIKGGELLNMLGLDLNVSDRMFLYQRRTGGARQITEERSHGVWVQPNSGLPTAVLIGDSFGVALAPILADAFSRLHYHLNTQGAPDPGLVERERPEVVVLITVERYLLKLIEPR